MTLELVTKWAAKVMIIPREKNAYKKTECLSVPLKSSK
jgi:hypothetical protein